MPCHDCRKTDSKYHLAFSDGNSVELCSECLNRRIGQQFDLQVTELLPWNLTIKDGEGKSHVFRITQLLVPSGIALEAAELGRRADPGYHFSVLGDFDCDMQQLHAQLLAKVTNGISRRYIRRREHRLEIVDDTVVGTIAYDGHQEGRVPLVIIDGKRYTWDQLGQMMMAFEGFQFKLDIVDPSEDVFDRSIPE